MENSTPLHTQLKKNSIGEGEYYKNRLQWKQKDHVLFQKMMSASAGRHEIILLREYKSLIEEILAYLDELNEIEPPASQRAFHQEMIILNQNAYQTCVQYYQDYQKSQLYFRRYVTTFYRLYPPVITDS